MLFKRSSGILLHPTSLPGPYGIGDLGPEAYHWVDFLSESGCKLWQVLPLGPTGYGDSPYQCFSAFAGNPYLISPELLIKDQLLFQEDLKDLPSFPKDAVDFGEIFSWKPGLLDIAYLHFEQGGSDVLRSEFSIFCNKNASWLDDYALFMALKDAHDGSSWGSWEPAIRLRKPEELIKARKNLAVEISRHAFRQWLFFRQWRAVREYAHEKDVKIIGDIPIFVAYDSADAWSRPELFYFDGSGRPTVVAGVPPDYFSPTGQLWGNPLYRWDVHKSTGYKWWIDRLIAILSTVDIIRLDHFRGFAGYWEVPGTAKTAERGRWVSGPGTDFMGAIRNALGNLPFIAEDLGEITPDVIELRDAFSLPGMKILQFGFSGPDNPFLPHHFLENCVVYTGSHDNDTALGWYASAPEHEKEFYRRYFGRSGEDFAGELIRAAWSSVAVMALAPLQDLLKLGTDARMNFPGKETGNWMWRMPEGALTDELKSWINELNFLFER
jgi:4-alpha-glucanotransferase